MCLGGTAQSVGTPAFMAPELLCEPDEARQYDPFAADMYSLGATLYTLAVGHPPFMAKNTRELACAVACEEPKFPP